jgi:hypothetical protein
MMQGNHRTVLVSDGGYEQSKPSVAAVRALAAAGYRPVVTVSGGHPLAAASKFCAGRIDVPSADDQPEAFAHAMREVLATGEFLTLIPTSDAVVRALRLASYELIDKAVLEERAPAAGLQCPPSARFAMGDDVVAAAGDFEYPVVVKAARYHASHRASRPADLARWRGVGGLLLVQPLIDAPQRAVSGLIWQGRLVGAVHQTYLRTWPVDPGGHAAAVVTTGPDPDVEERLLLLLSDHEGPFQGQFRGPYLLDLNPRVSTSLPLAVAAGVNLPAMYCDLRRGLDVPRMVGRAGAFYRWLDGDVRSIMWSWRRGRMSTPQAVQALRPRRGTVHGPESLRDPGPVLARTLALRNKLGRSGRSEPARSIHQAQI